MLLIEKTPSNAKSKLSKSIGWYFLKTHGVLLVAALLLGIDTLSAL